MADVEMHPHALKQPPRYDSAYRQNVVGTWDFEEVDMDRASALEAKYGVTEKQMEEWERAIVEGDFDALGEPSKIEVGRPLKFGEPLVFVGFKETAPIVEAMGKRAESLGLSRSDYLRDLVRCDLASA